jgi:hypothetical protein
MAFEPTRPGSQTGAAVPTDLTTRFNAGPEEWIADQPTVIAKLGAPSRLLLHRLSGIPTHVAVPSVSF